MGPIMDLGRLGRLRVLLAFLASVIAFALLPTAGQAHGRFASDHPSSTASTSPAPTKAQAMRAGAVEAVSALAVGTTLLAAEHGGGDTACPGDGSCCGAACHFVVGPAGAFFGTPRLVASTGAAPRAVVVLASPIFGLFRPPRA